MRSIGNVSLDAWLFGEDGKPTASSSSSVSASTASTSAASSSAAAAPATRPSSLSAVGVSDMSAGAKAATGKGPATSGPGLGDLSYPFPVSSKLRKLFRGNRLQWNRGPRAAAASGQPKAASGSTAEGKKSEDKKKKRQLLGLPTESFQRLQGHVPFTLKEIVKDNKMLPYLLRWLSTDTEEEDGGSSSGYHQVLLFLLELEQLQLVSEDKRREQALKIWSKYLDTTSEFQISSTLELTPELEQLVRDSIDDSRKAPDAFFPVQKLAYMRLTREEMPRFLKSDEYLHMLIETGNDTQAVPMERILQQPRAAHYFLLFLMQSRQHFELYFWLHVEYVLKRVLDAGDRALFWRLARVLVAKAQHDSQAITLATKNDLHLAIESHTPAVDRENDQESKAQVVAVRALFARAQQEIFVMLRSSWFDRFMKSNLYKVALQDSRIHLARVESKEDSPPKLLSRAFSSAEYFGNGQRKEDEDGGDSDGDGSEHDASRGDQVPAAVSVNEVARHHERADDEGGGSSSDDSDESEDKVELNLESIIRLTKLPDGLQVHYRPHYELPSQVMVPAIADGGADHAERTHLDWIVTFAAFVEKHEGEQAEATLMLMSAGQNSPTGASVESFDDVKRRIKTFLVPDGRVLLKRAGASDTGPGDTLFAFQQSGPHGFLFGSVFLTYEPMRVGSTNEEFFVAKGFCLLSRLPLVDSLRALVERHVLSCSDRADVFDSDRLSALLDADLSCPAGPAPTVGAGRVDVSVSHIFEHLGSALTLQLLASAALECSVVFVSRQYSLLTACAEAVRNLLRPFSWCHVYAPVLPQPLLSYLQCPTPILVGIHSDYALRSDLPTRGFYLVADLDRHVVEYAGAQSVVWRHIGLQDDVLGGGSDRIYLPRCFEIAKKRLDALLAPRTNKYDAIGGGLLGSWADASEHQSIDRANVDSQVRGICLDLFSTMLSGHSSACLVVGDTKESVVIFDETQFLSTREHDELPFYEALLRTQCFSEVVSAHRIDVSAADDELTLEGEDADGAELQEGVI